MQAHTKSHIYSKLALIQFTQKWTGAELSNIPDYQTVSILVSVISVPAGNYLFLLQSLGCKPIWGLFHLHYLLHLLVHGDQDPLLFFPMFSYLKKFTGEGTRGQEIPPRLTYRYSWRPSCTGPWDLPLSLINLSHDKKAKLLVLGPLSSSVWLSGFLNYHMSG